MSYGVVIFLFLYTNIQGSSLLRSLNNISQLSQLFEIIYQLKILYMHNTYNFLSAFFDINFCYICPFSVSVMFLEYPLLLCYLSWNHNRHSSSFLQVLILSHLRCVSLDCSITKPSTCFILLKEEDFDVVMITIGLQFLRLAYLTLKLYIWSYCYIICN